MAFLVEPSIEYKKAYIEMVEEWIKANEKIIPWVLRIDYSNFDALVRCFKNQSKGIQLKEGMVPSSTFWLMQDDKIIGAVNIRHFLTPQLLNIGGHIGYGIRPSERSKGFGTEMLRLALKKAKDIGIDKALITCDKDNIGSAKVIENNGGILDSEGIVNGIPILRYMVRTY
jgi:predicted acetyltransferase